MTQASAPVTVFPSMHEIRDAIPKECFERSLAKSLSYFLMSLSLTVLCVWLAYSFIPLRATYWPLWVVYAIVCTMVAGGLWVIAHECGHGAFCQSRTIQRVIGYTLHTIMLVPYFSWRHSHAVHHANTGHLTEDETHVPGVVGSPEAHRLLRLKEILGDDAFVLFLCLFNFFLGWPLYIFFGYRGGKHRGVTNHFWSFKWDSEGLFPRHLRVKMFWSTFGILVMIGLLIVWGMQAGFWTVMALYGGPYLGLNLGLVLITWLHHTDPDIPRLDEKQWTHAQGAFLTVDRDYGRLFNFLHHQIGSTHVVHHIHPGIPHYHAVRATEAISKAFPQFYHRATTPIVVALVRAARECIAMKPEPDRWIFTDHETEN